MEREAETHCWPESSGLGLCCGLSGWAMSGWKESFHAAWGKGERGSYWFLLEKKPHYSENSLHLALLQSLFSFYFNKVTLEMT